MSENTKIKSEIDIIDKLASIKNNSQDVNFDLLLAETKELIETKQKEIESYLTDNVDFDNYTEEVKSEMFDGVFAQLDELKGIIKNAPCHMLCTGLEVRTIDKKLHSSVEYTTETLFYGLHLKKQFLNTLPRKVDNDWSQHDLLITFSNAIAMHHVLSGVTVKGLNKESYAFAHIIYNLIEISKVYQFYDNLTSRLHTQIMQWNLGLSKDSAAKLNTAIIEKMMTDQIQEDEVVTESQD